MCSIVPTPEFSDNKLEQIKDSITYFSFVPTLKMSLSQIFFSTAAGLAQSAERLAAERKVAGSIPWAVFILRVLK